jgi:hypothetical protein
MKATSWKYALASVACTRRLQILVGDRLLDDSRPFQAVPPQTIASTGKKNISKADIIISAAGSKSGEVWGTTTYDWTTVEPAHNMAADLNDILRKLV